MYNVYTCFFFPTETNLNTITKKGPVLESDIPPPKVAKIFLCPQNAQYFETHVKKSDFLLFFV